MKRKKIAPPVATSVGEKKKTYLQNNYTSKKEKKQTKSSDTRSRNWTFIAWSKESIEKIIKFFSEEDKTIKVAISPMHIPDTGDKHTKPHWHIIVIFMNKKSYLQLENLIMKFKCDYPKPIGTMIGSAFKDLIEATRYLTHADHPFIKKTYEPREIIGLNGYEVEELFTAPIKERRKDDDENKILKILRDCQISNFCEATEYIMDEYPYLMKVFKKSRTLFRDYCNSRRYNN